MLQHASGSRRIDLGRPPAAAGVLRSQVPDLVLGPRQPLTLASCSKLVSHAPNMCTANSCSSENSKKSSLFLGAPSLLQ